MVNKTLSFKKAGFLVSVPFFKRIYIFLAYYNFFVNP